MNQLFETLKKPSRLVYIVLSFVYATLFLILTLGRGAGEFMPTVSSLIIASVGTAAIASIPLLIIFNKEKYAKFIFAILISYWVVMQVQNLIYAGQNIVSEMDGIFLTACIFSFMGGLLLLAAITFMVLDYFKKKPIFNLLTKIFIIAFIATLFTAMIFYLIAYGKFHADWLSFVSVITDALVVPPLVLFGYLYFFYEK